MEVFESVLRERQKDRKREREREREKASETGVDEAWKLDTRNVPRLAIEPVEVPDGLGRRGEVICGV